MKKIYYLFLIFLLSFSACQDDVLDKVPLDIITDNSVWSDQSLIDAYLSQVYAEMTVFVNETPAPNVWGEYNTYNSGVFDGVGFYGPFAVNELSDECTIGWQQRAGKLFKYNGIKIDGNCLEWWEYSYKAIRKLNEFIERVPNSPVDKDFAKKRIAEARFLRAFNYFAMVKRYGGVPIVTKAQSVNDLKEELYPKRNSEKEVYDFVISEMGAIVNDLSSSGLERPSKYAALALKCRAALYAGSIAKYGTVQLSGILGIASSEANTYYQKAYDAANEIVNSGKFALYNADANKVTNFKNIFLTKNHSEDIFVVRHDNTDSAWGASGNGWAWDFMQCPKPHGWDVGNQNAPYLEMAEEFERIDGTSGKIDRTALQNQLWSTDELWANRDPRFYATIWTQNTPWKGTLADFHLGIQLPDGSIQNDGSYQGVLAIGTQRVDGSMHTAFGVMKYLDESKDNSGATLGASQTDYIVFRYGEILLNFAEAAFELGKTGDALSAVNKIRTRAGIANLAAIDMEKIRHERKVELAFEGHRYWDLRRWRTAATVLTQKRSGLRFILDYTTRKYKIVLLSDVDGSNGPVFFPHNIYMPITLSRTGNNSNLIENPGY